MKKEKTNISRKKSWVEKRDGEKKGYPKIVEIPENWADKMGHGKMVILTPKIVDDFIRTIPKGKLATINLIRQKFAREYNADTTCPLTTGIFTWISAGAAEEERSAGKKHISPYWRVLKEGGKLNPKFPGGVKQQAEQLSKEGFKIIPGKSDTSWKVIDYENKLMIL